MSSNLLEQEKWDKVYTQTEPELLPWFGHSFPAKVEDYLSALNRSDQLLVTGCGVGDVVKGLQVKGFNNIKGTDISKVAIERAQIRFPGLNFETIPTEELASRGYKDVNTFDWLNLHQVKEVQKYLSSLGSISKSICLVWIYESNEQKFAQSYVHDGHVYYHSPEEVKKVLISYNLNLKKEFSFSFIGNPNGKIVREHKAICNIYER
jgi:predicted TPR repeat methyltransferase